MEDRKNSSLVFIKKQIFTSSENFKKHVKIYKKKAKYNHKNVVNFLGYYSIYEKEMCGQYITVNLLFQYYKDDLANEIC